MPRNNTGGKMFFVGLSGFIITLSLAVSFPGIFILFSLGAFPQSSEQIPTTQNIQTVGKASSACQLSKDTFHFSSYQSASHVQNNAEIQQTQVLKIAVLLTLLAYFFILFRRQIYLLHHGMRAPPTLF